MQVDFNPLIESSKKCIDSVEVICMAHGADGWSDEVHDSFSIFVSQNRADVESFLTFNNQLLAESDLLSSIDEVGIMERVVEATSRAKGF